MQRASWDDQQAVAGMQPRYDVRRQQTTGQCSQLLPGFGRLSLSIGEVAIDVLAVYLMAGARDEPLERSVEGRWREHQRIRCQIANQERVVIQHIDEHGPI